jgi:thioester reductase-like protein
MANAQNILLTGTGTIGSELLLSLVRQTPHRLLVLMRDKGRQRADERAARLFKRIGLSEADGARIEVLRGDVTQENLGLDGDTLAHLAETLDVILHTAAVTSLTLDRAWCDAVNRGGTANALTLAGHCMASGRLSRFVHFSTAFVAGCEAKEIVREDALLDAPQHLNFYEWSKYEAERIVRVAMRAGLPVTIFRPSMVVGNESDGRTRDFNVIYPLLRLMSSGYVTRFPADAASFVHLAPIDFVARAVLRAMDEKWTIGKTFHLTAPAPPTVADLLSSTQFFPLGAPRPMLVDPDEFDLNALAPREREVLESVAFSFPYFNSRVQFDTTNTARLVELPVADAAFVDRLGRYAVESGYIRFAKSELHRADLSIAAPQFEHAA